MGEEKTMNNDIFRPNRCPKENSDVYGGVSQDGLKSSIEYVS